MSSEIAPPLFPIPSSPELVTDFGPLKTTPEGDLDWRETPLPQQAKVHLYKRDIDSPLLK